MSIAIIAAILGGFGTVGAGLAMYTKIVQHLTRIETKVDQTSKLAAHVPGLYSRVQNLEHQLGVSPPQMPMFFNGSAED